jgi:hypothetical protein
MSAGDQNHSRAAQFKCLSDPTVPLSVWIVPITAASPFIRFPLEQRNSTGWGWSLWISVVISAASFLVWIPI